MRCGRKKKLVVMLCTCIYFCIPIFDGDDDNDDIVADLSLTNESIIE